MLSWLSDNLLQIIGSLAAAGWFLIKLGEWKRGVDKGAGVEKLRLEISDAARRAKHDAVNACAPQLANLELKNKETNAKVQELGERVARIEGRIGNGDRK